MKDEMGGHVARTGEISEFRKTRKEQTIWKT